MHQVVEIFVMAIALEDVVVDAMDVLLFAMVVQVVLLALAHA